MLVLYTEKQLEKAYKVFLKDYEGVIAPDLETFRKIYEASEELRNEDYEVVFEPEIESCGGLPAGFIPKDTSIH
mgnify:CR=1 FL=1